LKFRDPKIDYFNVPLLRDTQQIERPADQTTITRRYTEEADWKAKKNGSVSQDAFKDANLSNK